MPASIVPWWCCKRDFARKAAYSSWDPFCSGGCRPMRIGEPLWPPAARDREVVGTQDTSLIRLSLVLSRPRGTPLRAVAIAAAIALALHLTAAVTLPLRWQRRQVARPSLFVFVDVANHSGSFPLRGPSGRWSPA